MRWPWPCHQQDNYANFLKRKNCCGLVISIVGVAAQALVCNKFRGFSLVDQAVSRARRVPLRRRTGIGRVKQTCVIVTD